MNGERTVTFSNGGKKVTSACDEANSWLTENADRYEIQSMTTSASAVQGDGSVSEMFYITFLYRDKVERDDWERRRKELDLHVASEAQAIREELSKYLTTLEQNLSVPVDTEHREGMCEAMRDVRRALQAIMNGPGNMHWFCAECGHEVGEPHLDDDNCRVCPECGADEKSLFYLPNETAVTV